MRLVCSLFALSLLAAPLAACGKKAPLKEPPRREQAAAHPGESRDLVKRVAALAYGDPGFRRGERI